MVRRRPMTNSNVLEERLIILLVDMFLDSVSYMVVPIMLLVPFWEGFNFEELTLRSEVIHDDVFFAQIVTEMQIVAAGTWVGFGLRLVPHLSILSCLVLVSRCAAPAAAGTIQVGPSVVDLTNDTPALPGKQSLILGGNTQQEPSCSEKLSRRCSRRLHQIIELCFTAVGCIVLMIHLSAQFFIHRFKSDPLCTMVVAPWFATKFPCVVYTFDCEQRRQPSPQVGDLASLDERALAILGFANCVAMEVPQDVQLFSNLIGINLKNLTLVDCAPGAPSLIVFIVFSHANFQKEYLARCHHRCKTSSLFTHTNISVTPDKLAACRPHVSTLYLEFSHIREIPSSLTLMNLHDLSLIGNDIEDASVLEWLPSSVTDVSLGSNPLKVLPQRINRKDTTLDSLSAEHTLISHVSQELLLSATNLYLMDTPYCDHAIEPNSTLAVICDESNYFSNGKCLLQPRRFAAAVISHTEKSTSTSQIV
ncbi:TPA: hypothetical protein N0F65_011390 [Lagenidium giganteum]|uniref:Leucine-rich repeat domain, L domain-like n=1 Tax=Lagenidium giganteum TaxID=4803 RepID=A0AAV2Z897_9STRA|nr:TPA: hypothetical protein N0F65_011390 [Lagenidium giganteum]